VLLEAMAAGVPVLASDLEAFTAVLDAGRAGQLFRAGDPDDLARAAAALLDDPVRRAELVEAGAKVARRYDWDTVVQDVLAVYETVAEPGLRVRSHD
jgi:phosphatidylinositol alpha-mannosyltransferase